MSSTPSIDRLLNAVPDSPEVIIHQLEQFPELASEQDAHGYSLVHAAASYGHGALLRALVQRFNVDVNIKDEDGETALFSVETVDMAKELITLGIDIDASNDDGKTAAEKLDDEDEQPQIAAYLKEHSAAQTTGSSHGSIEAVHGTGVHDLPPVPNGMDISIGTMQAGEAGDAPDPEIRRRIEELAARPDFHEEAGQRELRELVSQVITGISSDEHSTTRRRID